MAKPLARELTIGVHVSNFGTFIFVCLRFPQGSRLLFLPNCTQERLDAYRANKQTGTNSSLEIHTYKRLLTFVNFFSEFLLHTFSFSPSGAIYALQ
jgi:hypothetical protein